MNDHGIFSVPYSNRKDFVPRALEEPLCGRISEFYGTDVSFVSGRWTLREWDGFPADVAALRQHGIGFNYLLNALGVDDYVANQDRLRAKLRQLGDCGVRTLTVSHPVILSRIQDWGLRFEISRPRLRLPR